MVAVISLALLAAVVSAVPSPQDARYSPAINLPLKRKPATFESSLRKRQSGWPKQALMAGDGYGWQYFTQMSFGTPPQEFDIHVDTGSDTLWVYGVACSPTECTGGGYFNQHKSSTYKDLGVPINQAYADGSASNNGTWSNDTVVLGDWSGQYTFGVINETSPNGGYPDTNISGIVGLGWGVDGDPVPAITRRIFAENGAQPVFGVYLDRKTSNWGQVDSPDSVLTLGGVNNSFFDGDLNYVNTIPSKYRNPMMYPEDKIGNVIAPDGWFIPIDGAKFGGQSLNVTQDQMALLDTGTPGIYPPPAVWRSIVKMIDGAQIDPEAPQQFILPCNAPNLNFTITLGGVEYPIYWGDLVLAADTAGEQCVCNVNADINVTGDNTWLLGDTFLRNVYTAYRYSPPSIGIAKLKSQFDMQTNVVPGLPDASDSATGGTAVIASKTHGGSMGSTATGSGSGSTSTGKGNSAANISIPRMATALVAIISALLL